MTDPKLRASQLVTTFGPGSMIDLPDASVIVAGLDHWRYDPSQLPSIDEPRLAAKLALVLGVARVSLRAPPLSSDLPQGPRQDVVAWRFPEWFIVQETSSSAKGHRRRRLVHLDSLSGRYRDADGRGSSRSASSWRARKRTSRHQWPVSFTAPRDARGPVDRGTWHQWRSRQILSCVIAGRARHEPGARLVAGARALPRVASVGPETEAGANRLLIRSFNAYFPAHVVISIPDTQSPVDDVVRAL